MQKALDQMNLQIHRVLNDITGSAYCEFWMPFWLAIEIRCAGTTVSFPGQEQPGYGGQGTGGRLSQGIRLRPETVAREFPLLSAAGRRGRRRDPVPIARLGGILGSPGEASGTDEKSRHTNANTTNPLRSICGAKQISGGRVLFTKSRRARSRVALALRMAANSLHHADNYLGEFFRRIARKLSKPQAITATAHKLARIVFHLLKSFDGLHALCGNIWS
jgi:hypothetical protein